MSEIDRLGLLRELEDSLASFKLTALLGPRRSGKTSLIASLEVPGENYLNLDDPLVQARLEHPEEVLGALRGLVVIDEFQRQPELLPVLMETVKGWVGPSRFLLLARVSPALMKGFDETSAGQVNIIRMGGLGIRELGVDARDRCWLRGGFPESYFAETDEDSARWRLAYVATFLRRDLPSFGIVVPPERLRRFWIEAARQHGRPWNSSAVAASLGVSHPTARSYLNLLTDTFMLRQLRPFTTGGKKRLVKAPKVYVRDSGLLHGLLEIESMEALESSFLHAASWKAYVLEQLVSVLGLEDHEMSFWATHGGAEIDLVVERHGKRSGFEFTVNPKPGVTHSMTIAKADLGLERVYLVYPGKSTFSLREGMVALGDEQVPEFGLL